MAYSTEVVRKARERLAQARDERERENREHLRIAYDQQPRLREIDRQLRMTMAQAARARRVPFGVEVVIGFVAAREAELSNVRIIMTGRMAGIPADTIRERLRESYV